MTSFKQDDVADFMRRYRETGDGLFLLWAIRNCGQYQITIPDDAWRALDDALASYSRAEVRSLDEAFQVNRPKGWNQSSEMSKRKRVNGISKAFAIFRRCIELNKTGLPIGMELFDKVGEENAVSGSTARKYYNEVKRELSA